MCVCGVGGVCVGVSGYVWWVGGVCEGIVGLL